MQGILYVKINLSRYVGQQNETFWIFSIKNSYALDFLLC